ncbi:MAG: hypothetical protein GTN76_02840 [Candidatus Aenigmarchaeota archaeon]|nr:hypothetical protein [Candidatus Aenigmarchaeota archaeon]
MGKRKRSYKYDEIKARGRHYFRNFIKKLGKDPRDIKVLFLPGKDAIEISEVFDPLGIPRNNLTGLENVYSIYDQLRRKNYGIKLFHTGDLEFFGQTDEKFDVINLDYESHFSKNLIESLKEVASRQILRDPGILLTNFLGRREKLRQKQLYITGEEPLHTFFKKIGDIIYKYHDNLDGAVSETKKAFDEVLKGKNVKLDDLREKIPDIIIDIFMKGECNKRIPSLYKLNPDFHRINEEFRDSSNSLYRKLLDIYGSEQVKVSSRVLEKILPWGLSLEDAYHEINTLSDEDLLTKFGSLEKKHFYSLIDKIKNSESFGGTFIIGLLRFLDSHPYFCTSHKSFKYISEGSSPMLLDFFYFTQKRDILEKYGKYIKINNKNDQLCIDLDVPHFTKNLFPKGKFRERFPDTLIFRRMKEIRNEMYKVFKNLASYNKSKRFLIGSSYKPKMTGKEFFKLKYVEGLTDEEIMKRGRLTPGTLRAFKTHAKMGTYGPIPFEISVEKPPEEEITKIKTYTITDLFDSNHPYGFLERLPKATETRLKYFLEEDMPLKINFTPEQMDQLVKNIAHSKWYRNAQKEGVTENQIYTFFDDIMLYCIWNEKVPDKDTIKNLLKNSLSGKDILPERLPKDYVPKVEKGGEKMSPRGSPRISKEAAIVMLKLGHDPLEISNSYSGFTPQQIRGHKKWNTMGKYDDLPLTSDLAYELFALGLETTDLRQAFPYARKQSIAGFKKWYTMRNVGE